MPTPRTLNGQLTTTQSTIYRVPKGKYAVVSSLSLINTSGTARTARLWVKRGNETARKIVERLLDVVSSANNDFSIDAERWVLESGVSIEANAGAGSAIDWTLMLLEFDQ